MKLGLKLKKGDKLIFVGLERDSQLNISRIVFETAGLNKVEFYADGEDHAYHCIGRRVVETKKFEDELDV